jgi:Fe-S-cluster-containing dehydrogenase component
MPRFGLLIDYEFCVGCRSCEIACKMEHHRPADQPGIIVQEVNPTVPEGKPYFIPFPTDRCNLCGRRRARGLEPSCVKHCWTGVIRFGTIEELAEQMRQKGKTVLWAPH